MLQSGKINVVLKLFHYHISEKRKIDNISTRISVYFPIMNIEFLNLRLAIYKKFH